MAKQKVKSENKKCIMSLYSNNHNIINKKIPYIENAAIQRNFDEMGGDAMFTSINQQAEVGSIYFRNGRLRLIHNSGPTIALHKNKKRYIIVGNFSLFKRMFKSAKRKGLVTDLLSTVRFMVEGAQGWSAILVGNQASNTSGRLFEVFFNNNNQLEYTHKSRGGVATIPNQLNPKLQRELYYTVKYSKILAKKIYNAISGNNINSNLVTSYISDCCIMASARKKAEPANEEAIAEYNSLSSIQRHINKIINDLNDTTIVFGKKRTLGYIGNMILRNSYDLGRAGLNVRNND